MEGQAVTRRRKPTVAARIVAAERAIREMEVELGKRLEKAGDYD